MTEKDMEKEQDRTFANFKQQTRVDQFSKAAQENRNVFEDVAAFLAVIAAVIAFAALIYGDACWAKSFPHKDYRLIKIFVSLTLVVVIFAVIIIASGITYLGMVDKISTETRSMYKNWVLDSADFRHDIDVKITTFIEYVTKEITGLFTMLASVGVIASAIVMLSVGYNQFNKLPNSNLNLDTFAAIHTLIVLGISTAVVLFITVPVVKTVIDLTSINFNSSLLPDSDSSLLPPGSAHHTWEFNTTFADRLALLQMPPKKVKLHGTKEQK